MMVGTVKKFADDSDEQARCRPAQLAEYDFPHHAAHSVKLTRAIDFAAQHSEGITGGQNLNDVERPCRHPALSLYLW
jgi:hypothetical protein